MRLALAAAVLAGCSHAGPPAPSSAPVWSEISDVGTVHVLTHRADGALRRTRVWLVVMDGAGYLRTFETRWFGDLERNPELVLRVRDRAHRLRAEPVEGPERERVLRSFREKYGLQDRIVRWLRRSDEHVLRLVPARPAAGSRDATAW